MSSSKNQNSYSYIDAAKQLTGGYGFTLQTEVIFPKKAPQTDPLYPRQRYPELTASLFGVHTARTSSTNTVNTQWAEPDVVNFQVHAVRDEVESNNIRFILTGSADGYFPELSSSLYEDAYDNTRWNLAVRVKPAKFPHADSVHGTTGSFSGVSQNFSRYYTVELYGNQTEFGTIQNEFTVTGNIDLAGLNPASSADQFIYGARRIYIGAHRTNFTGAVLQKTDAKISSCRFWLDYLDDETLRAHARDVGNYGAKHPYRNAYSFEGKSIYNSSKTLVGRGRNFEVPQIETLALNWDFNQVTGSDASGEFTVVDFSSGSANKRTRYGWIGDITKAQYTARGTGFGTSSAKIVDKNYIGSAKQNLPENLYSEDMISVLSTQDDVEFTRDSRPINHFFAFEKSMYQTISEEMINIFASIVDFNNLIGDPINKYRHEYKQLNKLRSLFFERVQNTPDLDKYVDFYKWFDDALSKMLQQLVPASADFSDDLRTVVESHVLERSKYQHKFPTVDMKYEEPEGLVESILPLSPGWKYTHAPILKETAGTSLLFDGSNDHVDAGNNSYWAPKITDPNVSFSFWIRPAAQAQETIFHMGGGNAALEAFLFNNLTLGGWIMYARMHDNSGNQSWVQADLSSAGQFTAGAWRHVAISFGTGYPSVYIDGVDRTPSSTSYKSNAGSAFAGPGTNGLRIGRKITYNFSAFAGHLADFAVFTKLLSSGEVSTIYNGGRRLSSTGYLGITDIAGFWKLGDGDGAIGTTPTQFTNAFDAGNPGLPTSTPTIQNTSPPTTPQGLNGLDENRNSNWWRTRAERHVSISSSAGLYHNSAKNDLLSAFKSTITRKKTTPYRFSSIKTRTIHGGINYSQNKRRDIVYNAVYPFGPILSGTNVPLNIAITFQSDLDALPTIDHLEPIKKRYMAHRMTLSRNQDHGAHYKLKGDIVALYNLVSSSQGSAPEAGYNKHVIQALTGANVPAGQIELVNLHSDTVGESNEIPMQGPFTEKYVGGRQHRHVTLNRAVSTKPGKNNLDSKADRPEGWRLLFDTCASEDETGAIAFVGPQYPDDGVAGPLESPPYLIDRPKAHLYREIAAKRPVNIKNILHTTGSPTIIGNYAHNYEVVHTVGRTQNDPFFRDQSVRFATASEMPFIRRGSRNKTGSLGYRNPLGLVDVQKEQPPKEQLNYKLPTRSTNKTVIVNRFSSPGGFEVMSRGYLDPAHEEYSPYNALPFRNLGIRGSGSGEAGNELRMNDHTGRRRGLQTLLKQRSGQFGHDADFGSVTALNYVITPSFHKVHRNRRLVPKLDNPLDDQSFITGSRFDNAFVTHVIPQSDLQYRWIKASALPVASNNLLGFAQLSGGIAPSTDILFLSASEFVSYTSSTGERFFGDEEADLVTRSLAQRTVWTDFAGVNYHIFEPLTASSGHLGYISTAPATTYANKDIINSIGGRTAPTTASVLNALLLHRNGPYQHPSWKQIRTGQHPVSRHQRKNNLLTVRTEPDVIEVTSNGKTVTRRGLAGNSFVKYTEPPVSSENKPLIHIFKGEMDTSKRGEISKNIKIAHSYGNNLTYFANTELNNRLGTIKGSNTDTMLNRINSVLFDPNTESPMEDAESIRFIYSERIFPRRRNSMGLNKIRTRTNFILDSYWADNRGKRTRPVAFPDGTLFPGHKRPEPIFSSSMVSATGALPSKVYGFRSLLSQSIWPLDAHSNALTVYSKNAGTGDGAGVLQNNYTTYHTASVFEPLKQFGPLYCRRTPGSHGVPGGDHDYFPGDTIWEAGTQAGKQPFLSYENYSDNLRLVGKDYSIVPEFRMSEHLDYYINDKKGDFLADRNNLLEITGGAIADSSHEDFYSVYSHTDFMKYFETVDDQYHEQTLTDGTKISRDRIALKCSALLKFLPYDGFYPVQRTVELSKLFYKDFVSGSGGLTDRLVSLGLRKTSTGARDNLAAAAGATPQVLNSARPYVEPFFAPGIMYNSIKSGIAVDYPVAISTKVTASVRRHTQTGTDDANQWFVSASVGQGIDKHFHRVPFEAIIKPSAYVNANTISGSLIFDMEPHPSGALSASLGRIAPFPNVLVNYPGANGKLYELAADNFFAECLNFFMKEDEEKSLLTTFVSKPESEFGTVVSGNLYSMRVNLDRAPINLSGRVFGKDNPGFYYLNENKFNMYDRPSAFGPGFCSHRSRVVGSSAANKAQQNYSYQPVTPSYYDGKSSALIVYRPDTTGKPTLDDIFAKSYLICQRSFPEYANGVSSAISDTADNVVEYVNSVSQLLAMQITASVDVFKSEIVPIPDSDQVSKRWVIQPKFETPILNFDESVDVTAPTGSLISNYDNASTNNRKLRQVSKGMWHQYGKVPTGSAGVWLSVTADEKITDPTIASQTHGPLVKSNSLADIIGMPLKRDRIGEVKTTKTISEAVVAVPFLEKQGRKVFFNVSRDDIDLALEREEGVGDTVQNMVDLMQKYVLPPKFDFIKNDTIQPFAMYMFEFSAELTKQDLVDIWQNLPPDLSNRFEHKEAVIEHDLLANEFYGLEGQDLDGSLKWLVFKAKRQAEKSYFNLLKGATSYNVEEDLSDRGNVVSRFNNTKPKPKRVRIGDRDLNLTRRPTAKPTRRKLSKVGNLLSGRKKVDLTKEAPPKYSYNWPYDYFSLVELIKVDAAVQYATEEEQPTEAPVRRSTRTPRRGRE